LEIAHVEITKKCEIYHKELISVWAIIEDRKLVLQRKLIGKTHIKQEIENKLDYYQPDWRTTMDVTHWEEEYRYAMNNNVSISL
jgi:ABC-type ATPase with predicted acetyltransferase domain